MQDKRQNNSNNEHIPEINLPLIIYIDDDGETRKTYSEYTIIEGIIIFNTQQNRIKLPISRLIKIKEPRGEEKDGTI